MDGASSSRLHGRGKFIESVVYKCISFMTKCISFMAMLDGQGKFYKCISFMAMLDGRGIRSASFYIAFYRLLNILHFDPLYGPRIRLSGVSTIDISTM